MTLTATKTKRKIKEPVILTELERISAVRSSIEKNQESNLEKMDGLRASRAKIYLSRPDVGSKPWKMYLIDLKKADAAITRTRKMIDNYPYEVTLLNKELVAEQARLKKITDDKIIEVQAEAAEDMRKLSKELVESLRAANKINQALTAATDKYVALHSKSGKDLVAINVTQGSLQMLKIIYETCLAEVQGQRGLRTQGKPPYVYI